MRLKDKRTRTLALALGLIVTVVLVWWAKVYTPLVQQRHGLELELDRLAIERHGLEKRIRKLSNAVKEQARTKGQARKLATMTVKAGTLEEANAIVQAKLQRFFEGHEIQLNAYKELPPSKWGTYQVGRIEFRLSCTTKRLAELLQFLNRQEAGLRVDKLEIRSRTRRTSDKLRITLRLASLFVKGNGKGS